MIDDSSYLVECDDLIVQPFHMSDKKDMLLFIHDKIKKLKPTTNTTKQP